MMNALADFESASDSIRETPQGKGGQSAENRYGSAYERLVQEGARPRLRAKYRGPKAMSRYSRGGK